MVGPGALGNVEGILLVAFVILGEALPELAGPAGIEQEQFQVVGFQFGIGGEL